MVIRIDQDLKELEPYLESDLYTSFNTTLLKAHKVDTHLLEISDNLPVSRCSLWWQDLPSFEGKKLGFIGHYAAQVTASGDLLEEACKVLKKQGCELAIGPMDGSTWRNYRFVTEGESEAFFLEPTNPNYYPAQWQHSGFSVCANYFSVLQTNLRSTFALEDKLKELEARGMMIRNLDRKNIEAELHAIFELSLKSFSQNFLYSAIDKDEFIEQYQYILPFIKDELVFLVEFKGQLIAFLFSLPDHTQKPDSRNRFIIKTLATDPEYGGQGIASCLTALSIARAQKLGFTQAIHALMFESNRSRSISQHYEQSLLRRYSLFSKSL